MSSWTSISSKERLGSQAQREARCRGTVKVLAKLEQQELAATWKLMNFFNASFVESIGKANLLARHLLANCSGRLTEGDLAAIKAIKKKSVVYSAAENAFQKAVLRRLREEVKSAIGKLRAELLQHIESESLELSPLASAMVVCKDMLKHYLPRLIDSELLLKMPNVQQKIKHIDFMVLLRESLSLCLRLLPFSDSLQAMRDRFSNQGNDVDMSVFQHIPGECRRMCAALEQEAPMWFYSSEEHCLVNLAEELASHAYRIRARVLLMARSTNDVEDLGELQSYAFAKNAGAVVAHSNQKFRECLQMVRDSLAVREHLRECEVSLEQVYSNLAAVSDTINDDHRAAVAKKRSWELSPGRDLPLAETVDMVHKIGSHYLKASEFTEAEGWLSKAVAMSKSMQPENPRALFITLNSHAEAYILLEQQEKAANCLRSALELCFRVGAAPKPLAQLFTKLALSEQKLQHFEDAEVMISQGIESHEKTIALPRAIYLKRLEKINEAKSILLRLIRKKPKLLSSALVLCDIAVFQESFPEASYWALMFQRRCPIEKHIRLAYAAIGDIELARRNYTDALLWFDREAQAVKALPRGFPVEGDRIRKRGMALVGLSRYEEAEVALRQALAKDTAILPESHETGKDLAALGMMYIQCARLSEAEDYLGQAVLILEKGLPLQSALAMALTALARIFMKKEDFEGAEERLRKAIAIDEALRPGHSHLGETYHLLADALRRLDRLDEAIEVYLKAVAILAVKKFAQVEIGEICQALAESCAVQGREEEASYYAELTKSYLSSP